MPLNRDYGSTEPFADPYTDAQHAYVAYGLQAAKRGDALERAALCWQRALGHSLNGRDREAHVSHAYALTALHLYPSLRIEVTGAVQPILNNHADALHELERAKAILERVRDSAILPVSGRAMRMSAALGHIDLDIAELEAGR
jgi:hypothetical protein